MTPGIGTERPLNLGHRGARGLAPENTLSGFRVALGAGVDGVELDVQRTADGHLVVFHDDDLQRVCGVRGSVVASPLARLRELEAGSHYGPQYAGEPIPTLEEVLDLLPDDCFVNIEAKRFTLRSDGLEALILETIRRRNLYDRCLVSSFDPLILWRMGRMDRRLSLGLLYEHRMPLALGRAWPRHFLSLAALNPQHQQVTPELVGYARSKGWQVNTWTVNEPAEMQRLIALGVNAIITDRPDLLGEALASVGRA